MEKALFVTKQITQVSASDLEGVGTIRWKDGKCYRWVKNGEATAQAIGNLVTHKLADGADLFKTVYKPLTANLMVLGGVCVSALPASGYGWIQVWGYNASASVAKEASAGDDLAVGDKVIPADTVYHGVRAGAGTVATYKSHLMAAAQVVKQTGAVASTTVVSGVFVRCL